MPNVPTPAGGMFSTAEDLLKLDRSLMNDNVLLNDEHKVLLLNRFNTDIKISFAELLTKPDFGMGVAGGSPGWNTGSRACVSRFAEWHQPLPRSALRPSRRPTVIVWSTRA